MPVLRSPPLSPSAKSQSHKVYYRLPKSLQFSYTILVIYEADRHGYQMSQTSGKRLQYIKVLILCLHSATMLSRLPQPESL
ncbi:hypothetical protein Xenpb_03738 [Xenorhabdus sp. PB62.4]|nr:hypothetical protein [Xenorhabdus sp. PB62.4]